jgi:hypothetical protein
MTIQVVNCKPIDGSTRIVQDLQGEAIGGFAQPGYKTTPVMGEFQKNSFFRPTIPLEALLNLFRSRA